MDAYCFTEAEWLPLDFQIMIAGVSAMGLGWFSSLVVCFRIIIEGVPIGWLLLKHNELQRSLHGRRSVVQMIFGEQERGKVLRDTFGLEISPEDQKHIIRTVAELKDDDFDFYGA